jgi:hypothetical protein
VTGCQGDNSSIFAAKIFSIVMRLTDGWHSRFICRANLFSDYLSGKIYGLTAALIYAINVPSCRIDFNAFPIFEAKINGLITTLNGVDEYLKEMNQ